jgi:Bifunctional DNA primase/polymerase, N-terminal
MKNDEIYDRPWGGDALTEGTPCDVSLSEAPRGVMAGGSIYNQIGSGVPFSAQDATIYYEYDPAEQACPVSDEDDEDGSEEGFQPAEESGETQEPKTSSINVGAAVKRCVTNEKSERDEKVDRVDFIRRLLPDAVLLKVKRGEKCPVQTGWQKLTQGDMTPEYLAALKNYNVSVLLGKASKGLCSIDIDQDEAVEPFLELNPKLRKTLMTKRLRGRNLWVRVTGIFPKLTPLKTRDGQGWGEWRADGGQTLIAGESMDRSKGETEPTAYRIVHQAEPVQLAFEEIVWPPGLKLPWKSHPLAGASPACPDSCATGAKPDPEDGLIILPAGEASYTDCAERLFRRIAPTHTLFSRGGAIMELMPSDNGILNLDVVKPAAFQSRVEHYGKIMVWRAGANGESVLKPTICPQEKAQALLETLEAKKYLPRISTIINSPVMIEKDGLSVLPSGYHPENGGIFVTGGETPPEIPAEEAVKALQELMAEFSFQTRGDQSRALAHLITPALKMGGFLTGFVPADVAEADQSQSGKTYRQRLTCAIYKEMPRIIARREGGVGSVDESFSQALIAGRPFIQFDNFRGKFDSQFIESFMTATGSFPARVPHRGEVMVDPTRFFLLLTSNGVETTRDLANRSSIVRIRKRLGVVFKHYPEGDLLQHVAARQAYYLGCVFSVIRLWVEYGKPRTTSTDHDFRDWAQTLDWIIQNIFHAAPLLEGHRGAQERVSNPALNFLRLVALEVQQANKLEETLLASDIVDVCEDGAIDIPGLGAGGHANASRRVGILMRKAFGDTDPIEVDGFTITRSVRSQMRADGGGSYEQKSYHFHCEPRTTA